MVKYRGTRVWSCCRMPTCQIGLFLPRTTSLARLTQGCAPISRTTGPSRCTKQPSRSQSHSLNLPWGLLRRGAILLMDSGVPPFVHSLIGFKFNLVYVITQPRQVREAMEANAMRNPKALSASACLTHLIVVRLVQVHL